MIVNFTSKKYIPLSAEVVSEWNLHVTENFNCGRQRVDPDNCTCQRCVASLYDFDRGL